MKHLILSALVLAAFFAGMAANASTPTTHYEKVSGPRWMADEVRFTRCDDVGELMRARVFAQVGDELLIIRCERG